jgi:hypothetical protein
MADTSREPRQPKRFVKNGNIRSGGTAHRSLWPCA